MFTVNKDRGEEKTCENIECGKKYYCRVSVWGKTDRRKYCSYECGQKVAQRNWKKRQVEKKK